MLGGQRRNERHAAQLRTINDVLRQVGVSCKLHISGRIPWLTGYVCAQELAAITDQHVVSDLRAADVRAGHWLNDDPSLATMLNYIRSRP